MSKPIGNKIKHPQQRHKEKRNYIFWSSTNKNSIQSKKHITTDPFHQAFNLIPQTTFKIQSTSKNKTKKDKTTPPKTK
jgi:hypothetical protein